ncbi:hypothetical protein [Shewanella sp. FJAT-52076]|uniref:hypothetical protein n=1 Tax=Shewanella sp. FJAT-52076 TaxID=2864202 RepID=UPI001C65BFF6|nr:hypothetical protein [Shewanella sp. FJAT-52076]QYJ73669.1 hypothetical protein K0H79_09630 [Shewanella sp. FJAT-52076]
MTNSSNSNDSSRNPKLKTPGMQENSIQSGGHEACAEEDKSNGLGDSLAPAPQPIHAHRHDRQDDGYVASLSLFATRTPKDVSQLHLAVPVLPARGGDNLNLGIERTDHTSGSVVVSTFTAFRRLDAGERPETVEQEETQERDRIDVRQTLPLKLLLPVTLVHLAVLGLLAWQLAPQLGSLSAALDERANQPKALQSYLVFSAAKQPIEQPPAANPSEPAAVIPQPEPEQVKREQVNEQKAPIEPALATAPKEPAPIKDEPLPAQPAVEPEQKARRESLPPIETPAPSEQSQLDFSTPASRFMARQNAQALNALSQSYADEQTIHMNAAGRGMSELLPEMEVLLVPDADDFYKPNTLDSDIDPNRIVKSGDTCYRVVKVPTPINPHAENLGFPFRCGEDRVKKALREGINKYLALMGKQDLH